MPGLAMPDIGQMRRGLRFGDARDRADDARRSAADISLPNIDWSRFDPSKFDISKVDFSKLDLPARAELAKQIRKASKDQLRRASKELNRNLPGRGPSPVPFAILGAIGGLIVGWIIATTPAVRSAIEGAFAGVRRSVTDTVAGMSAPTAGTDEPDLAAWTRESRTPVVSDTYAAAVGAQREPVTREAGVGVGPGHSKDEPGS
jgi:hypothetical protein